MSGGNDVRRRPPRRQSAVSSRGPDARQLRTLIDMASDAVFVADLEGRYTYVNEAACRLLGYARDELVGMTIVDLIPADQVERLWRARESLRAGGVEISEWTLRRVDGTRVPVEVSAAILPDGRWQAFVREITERKRIEGALVDSESRLRAIVRLSTHAIFTIDGRDLRILAANPAAEEIFGRRAEEIVGREIDSLVPERLRDVYRALAERVAAAASDAREIVTTRPMLGLRASGEEFPAEAGLSRIVRGDPSTLTLTVRDCTDEVRALEEERFLADAGAVLASSLDPVVTLDQIGTLAVRDLADYCIVDLVHRGTVERFRVFTRREADAPLAARLESVPLDRSRSHLAFAVISRGEPLLVEEVSDEYLASVAQGEAHLAMLREIAPQSILGLPLLARGRFLGALILLATRRRYGGRNLRIGVELARRAAMAIDNAELVRTIERTNSELRDAIARLESARKTIRILEEFLPTCAWCKKIRDDAHGGEWMTIERFVVENSSTRFTHGICPECAGRVGAELDDGERTREKG